MKAEGYKRGSIGKRIIRGILLGGLLGIGLCSCGKEKRAGSERAAYSECI